MSQGEVAVLPKSTGTTETGSEPFREAPNNNKPVQQSSQLGSHGAQENSSHPPDTIEKTGPGKASCSNPNHPLDAALLGARVDALHTLSLCRTVITSLELTRMRKSRVGFSYWLSFWQQLYERSLARSLGSIVSSARSKIDFLFRDVSRELQQVAARMEHAVTQAASEKEILNILERMEAQVGYLRNRRREKAQEIVDKMRAAIQAIPVIVSDELLDDMKRGIFALDVYCNYYPVDSETEDCQCIGPGRFLYEQQYAYIVDLQAQNRPNIMPAPPVAVNTMSFHVPGENLEDAENHINRNHCNDENRPWHPREGDMTDCW